jgi:hypothetical protein
MGEWEQMICRPAGRYVLKNPHSPPTGPPPAPGPDRLPLPSGALSATLKGWATTLS